MVVDKESFDDIQMDLSTRHSNRFLQVRLEYQVAWDHFYKVKDVDIENMHWQSR